MLFEEEMCGKGMMCQWPVYNGSNRPAKQQQDSRKDIRHSWNKSGRRQGYWGKGRRVIGHPLSNRLNRRPRPSGSAVMSLRPVNIKGNKTSGMRAPKNTNQFLMHEKYQMMHMRSDSIGTDSGSDSEMDFTDMDSYLGVLENARGALLDSPNLSSPKPAQFLSRQMAARQRLVPFFTFGELYQEESMEYFPSEHDVIQSEGFMRKDFIEFCDTFRGTEHLGPEMPLLSI